MEHIGICACSAEGAALCFKTICVEGEQRLGRRYAHPEVSMHTHPFDVYMERIEAGDWQGVADLMADSAGKLASVGAQFCICPDNTIHQAYDEAVSRSPIPWLHIAEVVASKAKSLGYRRLGVLGTRFLMEGPVYRSRLERVQIEWTLPNEEDRAEVNNTIFQELVMGRFTEEARDRFHRIIERLEGEGCDAVVLGCTEIPLLVDSDRSPLPVLDSTRLLARAALDRAAGEGTRK